MVLRHIVAQDPLIRQKLWQAYQHQVNDS